MIDYNDISRNEAYRASIPPVRVALDKCVALYRARVECADEKNRAFRDSLILVTDYLRTDLYYDMADIAVMCGIKEVSAENRCKKAREMWLDLPESKEGRQILQAWRDFSAVMPETREEFEKEVEKWQ